MSGKIFITLITLIHSLSMTYTVILGVTAIPHAATAVKRNTQKLSAIPCLSFSLWFDCIQQLAVAHQPLVRAWHLAWRRCQTIPLTESLYNTSAPDLYSCEIPDYCTSQYVEWIHATLCVIAFI